MENLEKKLQMEAKLAAKLSAAHSEVLGYVTRDYLYGEYIDLNELLDKLRPCLHKNKLAVYASEELCDVKREVTDRLNKEGVRYGADETLIVNVKLVITLIDIETGYSKSSVWHSYGCGKGDLSVHKVSSMALRKWAKTTFWAWAPGEAGADGKVDSGNSSRVDADDIDELNRRFKEAYTELYSLYTSSYEAYLEKCNVYSVNTLSAGKEKKEFLEYLKTIAKGLKKYLIENK